MSAGLRRPHQRRPPVKGVAVGHRRPRRMALSDYVFIRIAAPFTADPDSGAFACRSRSLELRRQRQRRALASRSPTRAPPSTPGPAPARRRRSWWAWTRGRAVGAGRGPRLRPERPSTCSGAGPRRPASSPTRSSSTWPSASSNGSGRLPVALPLSDAAAAAQLVGRGAATAQHARRFVRQGFGIPHQHVLAARSRCWPRPPEARPDESSTIVAAAALSPAPGSRRPAARPEGRDQPGRRRRAACDPAIAIAGANLACTDADVLSAPQLLRVDVAGGEGPADERAGLQPEQHVRPGRQHPAQHPRLPLHGRARAACAGTTPTTAPPSSRWPRPAPSPGTRSWSATSARPWRDEMRYLGRHVLLAPTINQVTHPRWGRAQESYGEDSFLLGEMGAAVRQRGPVRPEGRRSRPTPARPSRTPTGSRPAPSTSPPTTSRTPASTSTRSLDERTLREVYLPHFKKAVDAGVCVRHGLLQPRQRQLQRLHQAARPRHPQERVGLRRLRRSPTGSPRAHTLTSPVAGLDIEMPFSSGAFPSMFDSAYFYGTLLSPRSSSRPGGRGARRRGRPAHPLRKVHYGVIGHAGRPGRPWLTKSDAAQALALESARQGIVLLKNGPTSGARRRRPAALTTAARQDRGGRQVRQQPRTWATRAPATPRWWTATLVITPYEGISERPRPPTPRVPPAAAVQVRPDLRGRGRQRGGAPRLRRGRGGGGLLLRRPGPLLERRGGRVEGPRQP